MWHITTILFLFYKLKKNEIKLPYHHSAISFISLISFFPNFISNFYNKWKWFYSNSNWKETIFLSQFLSLFVRVWEARKVGVQENMKGLGAIVEIDGENWWIMQGPSGVAFYSYFGFHFKSIWVNEGFGYGKCLGRKEMARKDDRRAGDREWERGCESCDDMQF